MPLYSYECPEGHRTEMTRSVEGRNDPLDCGRSTPDGVCLQPLRRRFHAPAISMEGRAYRDGGFDANDWLASQ